MAVHAAKVVACGEAIVKRAHRTVHKYVWTVLLPLLLALIYIANERRESVEVNAKLLPDVTSPDELP